MPFVLLVLGLLFLIVAVRGTQNDFFSLVKQEFTGQNNFVVWASAFIILGLIGYIKTLKPVSDAFIGLIALVLILTKGQGFFSKFNAGIRSPVAPSGSSQMVPAPGNNPVSAVSNVAPGNNISDMLNASNLDLLNGMWNPNGTLAGTSTTANPPAIIDVNSAGIQYQPGP